MTADRELRTADFDYDLPAELVAQTPAERRGDSRLLVVRRSAGSVEDLTFGALPELIAPGDLLVLNTTRVRHARLLGTRPSGAPAEVLLIHPGDGDTWVAMGKPGSALRPGKRVRLADDVAIETTAVLEDGHRLIRFLGATAEEAMARFGRLPLPPYVSRDPTPADEERYQTVFARREGSVAAPTAGLHFTTELLDRIHNRGVSVATLDLEVGPGTFKPVEAAVPADHPMHAERFTVPDELPGHVAETRARGGAVWACGTTVVRALESAADERGVIQPGARETRLLILPGYRFRVVDRLITNFHLPRSTLLMLVSAFAGHETTMAAYRHAVTRRYRFYSYGDAMVIV